LPDTQLLTNLKRSLFELSVTPASSSSVSVFSYSPRHVEGVSVSIKSLPVPDSLKKASDHFNVIRLHHTSRWAFGAIETDFAQQMPRHDYFEN
jgi:hypothetical protein